MSEHGACECGGGPLGGVERGEGVGLITEVKQDVTAVARAPKLRVVARKQGGVDTSVGHPGLLGGVLQACGGVGRGQAYGSVQMGVVFDTETVVPRTLAAPTIKGRYQGGRRVIAANDRRGPARRGLEGV